MLSASPLLITRATYNNHLLINGEPVKSCPCNEGVNRWAYVEMKTAVNFYKSKQQEASQRAIDIQEKLTQAEAEIRLLKQKLFGKKSEGNKKSDIVTEVSKEPKRKRGQQKGAASHGRRDQSELLVHEEFIELQETECCCIECKLPFEEINGTEDSELIEIAVTGHVRKIRRKKYKPHKYCQCNSNKQIITAPPIEKLIPKSRLGISVWIEILVRKYQEHCPLYRLLKSLKTLGISIAQGTVTGGLKKIAPLFIPIYKAFKIHAQQDKHWHSDETRWEVFEKIEGKKTSRWYLWVFRGSEAIVYSIDPTRGYKVAEDFFKDVKGGIISCDRYIVYKKIAKNFVLILALCWAHVRRDFIDAAKSEPKIEEWSFVWIAHIRELYKLNKERLQFEKDSVEFLSANENIKKKISVMETQFEAELDNSQPHKICHKVLLRLKVHWKGLTLFVDHPEIPMDNNPGEQSLRGPVVGRKSYYGSGSIWSAKLTAMLFTVFATLALWGINSRTWLSVYLKACVENGGKSPKDINPFLPWKMSQEEIKRMRYPP